MTLGAMLLTVAGGCTPAPTVMPNAAQVAASSRFSGEWDTPYGRLSLAVDGTRVSGVYGGTGRIKAIIADDGQSITGTWAEPPNLTGGVMLVLDADGRTLHGTWTERGGVGQSTTWTGTKVQS
jgi:hypothetical protein